MLLLLRLSLLKLSMIGVFDRAKKLTMWMIPRIKYWLSVEAAVPKRAPDGPPRTKHELFNQAEATGFVST